MLKQFIDDVKEVYGLEKYYITNVKCSKCKDVRYHSKLATKDLLKIVTTYSCRSEKIRVPNVIENGNHEIKSEFLRCFWSDDGGLGIYQRNMRFELIGTQKNSNFLKEIAELHRDFNIGFKIQEKQHRIRISNKNEIIKFFKRIGFLTGSLVTKGNFVGREKNDLLNEMLNIKGWLNYGPVV